MKKTLFACFEPLTFAEIANIEPGRYGDHDLLGVMDHFSNEDDDRVYAVLELILRSPDYDDMVDYPLLYSNLIEYYHMNDDYPAALRWAYAGLAAIEQRQLGDNRANFINLLAASYLYQNDLNSGIKLFIRRIQHNPGDLDVYRFFGMALWHVDLNDLALEVVHRGLALTSRADDHDMLETLESLEQDIREEELAADVVTEVAPHLLAEIRAALCLDAEPVMQETEPYLPPIHRLLDPETATDPALSAEILAQPWLFAPDLIRLAFDENLPSGPALERVIALLRQMQPVLENEFTALAPWLERADGDWRKELLLSNVGKVGGFSTAELKQFARNTLLSKHFRIHAIESLPNRLADCPEQRPEIVAFLREMLTRPDLDQASEEAITSIVIVSILDIDARELYPEIKAAFDLDSVEPIMVSLDDIHAKWDMPPVVEPETAEDSLYLALECLACGRVRKHTTRYVLVDINSLETQKADQESRYSPYILDHEIICPKCGARDQYKLTLLSLIGLLSPRDPYKLMDFLSGNLEPNLDNSDPRIFYFQSMALGQEMNPLKAVDEYRNRLLQKPGDARLHAGFGRLLRLLGRPSQAVEEIEFARMLDPKNPENLLNLAMLEHDFGDHERARQLYNEVILADIQEINLQKSERTKITAKIEIPFSPAASEGLKAIQSGGPSPWYAGVINSQGKALSDYLNEGVHNFGGSRSQKRRKSRKGK